VNKKYLESIKVIDGEIFHLQWHQSRVDSVFNSLSCKSLFLLKEIINPPAHGLYRCRVIYDALHVEVSYIPYIKRSIKTLKLVHNDTIEYSKKYANRELLEELYLLHEHCDDILIVKNNYVTDTTIANIAFFDGVKWFTPKHPLLCGTTRARFLYEKKIFEKNITPADIKTFKRVALMNAMIDFDIITEDNCEDIIC